MDIDELEARARTVLDPAAYDYYAGGADDERTLLDNTEAWSRLRLRPHVLRDVGAVRTHIEVLGCPITMPVIVAPMAYQRLASDEGEAGMARGAAEAGTIMVVSTLATVSLEDVAAAAPGAARWFQLYVHKDRGFTEELVQRAVAAGYRAIVLTVDLPVFGHRPRDERNGFALPPGLQMANVGRSTPDVEGSAIQAYAHEQLDPTVTFDDLGWLKGLAGSVPVVVKGVLRGDDAARAVGAGADAVIVSNHGGRQLDTAVATADALADVVAGVDDRAPVFVDGGIRHGTDVVKALSLGAQAVLVGRPLLWALAAEGSHGVRTLLDELRTATERTMALCGVTSPSDVPADLVVGGPSRRSSRSRP